MELLRIIAMSMILISHFVVHGSDFSLEKSGLGMQNAFIYYGVNIFVMISGYYGIRLHWRSFLSLIITILTFSIINQLLYISVDFPTNIDLRTFLYAIIMPQNKYWFVSCYLLLFLLAPIINIGLTHATKIQLRTTTLILTLYFIYSGFVNEFAILGGFSVAMFIILYVIGFWIRVDSPFRKIEWYWLLVIAVACSLLNVSGIWTYIMGQHAGILYTYRYTNLLCLVGAVAIFLIFERLAFKSSIINSIAAASFGCYLLQDGYWGQIYSYPLQRQFYQEHTFSASLGMYVICFVALWLGSWVITQFINLWRPKLVNTIIGLIPQRWKQEIW